MRLVEVNCYNCGGREHSAYAEENGFQLVKCVGCGLLYVRMRPDDSVITEAHRTGQHRGAVTLDVTGVFNWYKTKRYERVLRDLYGNEDSCSAVSKWLDIGCGHGEFLVALARYFGSAVSVRGIEPNENKRTSARRHGLDVTFFDLENHDDKYDRISLLNVYSHLPDPPATFGSWSRLLTAGGELLVQTGDTADLKSDEHYRPLYLPDHLSFASERIVVGILERLGFKIVAVRKYPLLERDAITWLKETVKLVLPGKESRLKYLIGNRRFPDTDMFIRARRE